jgi:hypothetical protein
MRETAVTTKTGCWCGYKATTHAPGLLKMVGVPYHVYGEPKPEEPDTYEKLRARVRELADAYLNIAEGEEGDTKRLDPVDVHHRLLELLEPPKGAR